MAKGGRGTRKSGVVGGENDDCVEGDEKTLERWFVGGRKESMSWVGSWIWEGLQLGVCGFNWLWW